MDANTMERLLIDKRLGELPPDTEQLLHAYLRLAPGGEAAAAEIDGVISLASQALRQEPLAAPDTLPPLSISEAVRRKRPPRSAGLSGGIRPLAMAAALVLAFLLGMRQSSVRSTASLDRSPRIAHVMSVTAEGAEFWSVAKYVSDRSAGRPSKGDRVEWRSPLVWPQFGERL